MIVDGTLQLCTYWLCKVISRWMPEGLRLMVKFHKFVTKAEVHTLPSAWRDIQMTSAVLFLHVNAYVHTFTSIIMSPKQFAQVISRVCSSFQFCSACMWETSNGDSLCLGQALALVKHWPMGSYFFCQVLAKPARVKLCWPCPLLFHVVWFSLNSSPKVIAPRGGPASRAIFKPHSTIVYLKP